MSSIEEPWEKEHGRLEKRKYEVFSALPTLNKWKEEWPYIRQIIRVTRYRQVLSSQKEMSVEVVHYASNSYSLRADQYAKIIRNHWSIENQLHYVKDKTVQEDILVKRENPNAFSSIIDCALNILRISKTSNIRNEIYRNSLNLKNTIYKFNKFLL